MWNRIHKFNDNNKESVKSIVKIIKLNAYEFVSFFVLWQLDGFTIKSFCLSSFILFSFFPVFSNHLLVLVLIKNICKNCFGPSICLICVKTILNEWSKYVLKRRVKILPELIQLLCQRFPFLFGIRNILTWNISRENWMKLVNFANNWII